jgi:aryl-phospho-beta-D-glucosidase BglC (GH1 family)
MTFHQFLKHVAVISGLILMPMAPSFCATAVATHGAISVKGNQIVGSDGKALSLAGPSLFWSNSGWEGDEHRYYNAEVVSYVQKQWNAGIIRAAIGADKKGGYQADPKENYARLQRVMDAAIAEGMYVIVDFHSHDAHLYPDVAVEFFEKVATQYGKYPNVIYEIYNEPLNTADWVKQVKPYSEKVISKIRAIDPDNLIVVGSPTWSQDVDKAAADPIKNVANIAYALHFYAGTHKQGLRDKAQKALDLGVALMVTEWGAINANGDGAIDHAETARWLEFMQKNKLTHCSWALSDKKESASHLKNGTLPHGKWTDADLTEAGLFIKDIVLRWSPVKYFGAAINASK